MEARAPANRRHRPSRTHKALAALARKVSRAAAKYYSKVAMERAHEEDEWFDYGEDLSDVIRGVTFVQNVEYPDVLEPRDSECSSDSDGEEDGEIAGDDEEVAIVKRADEGEGEGADEGQEGIGEDGGEEDIEVAMIDCYLAEEIESRIPSHEWTSLSEATTSAEEEGAAEGGSAPPTTHPDKGVRDLDRDGKVALKNGRGAPPTTQPQEPSPARQQEPAPAREQPHSAGGVELMNTMAGTAGRALRRLRRS